MIITCQSSLMRCPGTFSLRLLFSVIKIKKGRKEWFRNNIFHRGSTSLTSVDTPPRPAPLRVRAGSLRRRNSLLVVDYCGIRILRAQPKCHAKVQNLLQSANTFTTFNDKMMDILYMQYTIIGVKKNSCAISNNWRRSL